jgi:hypothetical protein
VAQDVSALLDKLNALTRERNIAMDERNKAVEAATKLIERVHGDVGRCKACLKLIYWVRHREGPITAYDRDGIMHITRCPHAKEFSRGPRQQALYEGIR